MLLVLYLCCYRFLKVHIKQNAVSFPHESQHKTVFICPEGQIYRGIGIECYDIDFEKLISCRDIFHYNKLMWLWDLPLSHHHTLHRFLKVHIEQNALSFPHDSEHKTLFIIYRGIEKQFHPLVREKLISWGNISLKIS